MDLKQKIVHTLEGKVDAIGFAPVERFGNAPQEHHPSEVCKDARTIVVFGKVVPRGMIHSPTYNLYIMHRAYHSAYPYLDEIALMLSNWIEAQGRFLAVPVPSYAPMVFHGREPWGVMSLKHAAVEAGLGRFGKNGLMHHPRYGTLLRLGAVVTNAEMAGDPKLTGSPCAETCTACLKACPSEAFGDDGSFKKMTCLAHTIKHAIYPLAFQAPEGMRHIERVINTAGYNYWLSCDTCLKVCPNNRANGIPSGEA
ncbi:MAG TPA: 4Fe-4S double cluster binding domain-containing protein [Desulfomonilaceae bacterium]|nr:4Fe-4S double cluster binding domain-containing protein [Desulfomonilaceae bacterium]